ncbi:MAG: AAA family ATPase [Rikenellaceae bacterium]
MAPRDFSTQIYNNFGFPPTLEQKNVVKNLAEFISDGSLDDIFILNGYAGVGKTTIIAALVNALKSLNIQFFMLAPTGRAAKVVSQYSGHSATTVHKKIYRQKSLGAGGGNFSLNYNKNKNAIYIVDEASMLSNTDTSTKSSTFGSGHLIDDLVDYIRMGEGNKLILVGDDAQLPPVGLSFSPALNPYDMNEYGTVQYSTIKEVVRQAADSGILKNATILRKDIEKDFVIAPRLCRASDVRTIHGGELIEELESAYSEVGIEDTIVITRSNKRAVEYNRGIRRTVLDNCEELSSGDIIMVVKNNYYIAEREKSDKINFIANGDIAVVERVVRNHEIYGFRFATLRLRFPDYDNYTLECKVLLDTLYSEAPALSREDSERLFYEIEKDYLEIGERRKRYKKIMENEYWGALQIKFGYAVTCHKAQGGQWKRIFIDRLLFGSEVFTRDFQRWLYTAVTRATQRVYFVNWQDDIFKG